MSELSPEFLSEFSGSDSSFEESEASSAKEKVGVVQLMNCEVVDELPEKETKEELQKRVGTHYRELERKKARQIFQVWPGDSF